MNKFKYYISHLTYIINSEKFIITFIFMILLNIFEIFRLDSNEAFFYGLYAINTSTIINVFLVLFCVLNSSTIYDYMESNKSYIIRCENKNTHNNAIIKNMVLLNTFIIITWILIGLVGLLIKYMGNYEVGNYYFYNISNIIYFLFFSFRKIVYINLLVVIFIYVRKLLGKITMNFCLFLFITSMITYYYKYDELIVSFSNIRIFIGYYFALFPYASFSLELTCSLFMGILLTIAAFSLYKLVIKFGKQVTP